MDKKAGMRVDAKLQSQAMKHGTRNEGKAYRR